jgi:hypothetical protein
MLMFPRARVTRGYSTQFRIAWREGNSSGFSPAKIAPKGMWRTLERGAFWHCLAFGIFLLDNIIAVLAKPLELLTMPSPFPGMDPYLETPDLWPDVHHGLIGQIQAELNPLIKPHYVARVELRVYISDEDDPGRKALIPDLRVETSPVPRSGKRAVNGGLAIAEPLIIPMLIDDEIEEAYLSIKDRRSGALVAIVEIMSPTNKIRGSEGRTSFMRKKKEVIASKVHWVEIDLLRSGDPSILNPPLRPSDYRVLVSRGNDRYNGRYWPIGVRQQLPVIGVPLKDKDPDVPLDLSVVLANAYDNGAYDASIDYSKPPVPPLSPEDARWATKLLRAKGLR